MNKKPIYYMQTDPRWGGKRYPTATGSIGIYGGGCGPTCCAMLITTLLGMDKLVLPPETMEWACKTGWVRCGDGVVSGEYFPAQFKRYGLTCEIWGAWSRARVEEALRAGDYFIAGMGPGLWTRGGHFVVVWWADDKVRILDPASTADARTNGDPALFWSQVRNFYRVDAREYNRKDEIEMTKKEFLDSLTPEEAAQIVDLASKHVNNQPPSKYAEGACRKAVKSGIFKDGDEDGLLDFPQGPLSREQGAVLLDRLGLLDIPGPQDVSTPDTGKEGA